MHPGEEVGPWVNEGVTSQGGEDSGVEGPAEAEKREPLDRPGSGAVTFPPAAQTAPGEVWRTQVDTCRSRLRVLLVSLLRSYLWEPSLLQIVSEAGGPASSP